MSRENSIVKVGNILSQLEEAFESYTKDKRDSWPTRLYCETSQKIEDSMLNMCQEEIETRYSWFSSRVPYDEESCIKWHFDVIGNMLISSYPNPTQFLIYEEEVVFDRGCIAEDNDKIVDELVEQGKATIFTPEVGDVYLAKNFQIHRTNPKAHNNPHLVSRVWLK